ncbi:Protein CBR-RABX-5 [Caenorhabditis briggsae]|uniref:Protein CBR-RABX-5 n=1 Tax=Caenorhabditis briggsae TaxID=6238 RepID=A8XSI2_CAEBR|nr:Protein CBR-RABX-5 [Caenorhabditis briggsae]CAP35824.2 Protein CBR-RABX-5 [Caenorhabditis briggsae]
MSDKHGEEDEIMRKWLWILWNSAMGESMFKVLESPSERAEKESRFRKKQVNIRLSNFNSFRFMFDFRSLLSFDQFQERRKSTTESKSRGIKNLFKTSPIPESGTSSPTSTSPSSTPTRRRDLSPDSLEARKQFSDFLVANLSTAMAQEIARSVKNAVNKISEMRLNSEDMSDLVISYYQYLGDRIGVHSYFNSPDCKVKVEDVMDQVEKYISTCCYAMFFCASHDEEVADMSLQDRIRSLHWVTAGFLETKLVFKKQNVRDKVDEAITELIEINAKKSAFEKLDCLTRSCKAIFEALKESESSTSADEFLPTLIYILFRGNPPLIQSNVKFISRFAVPARLMSGEAAYFFTNLSCALEFARNMNHESLQMEKAEFEAYTSGHMAPPLSVLNSACNQAMYVLEGTIETIATVAKKAEDLLKNLTGVDKKSDDDLEKMLILIKETVDIFPTDEYIQMKESIFAEEQETADLLVSLSRQSSDLAVERFPLLPTTPNLPLLNHSLILLSNLLLPPLSFRKRPLIRIENADFMPAMSACF